jgi:hypothetical protein
MDLYKLGEGHIQRTLGGDIRIDVTKVDEGLKIEVWKNGRNDPYTVEPTLETIVKWDDIGAKQ